MDLVPQVSTPRVLSAAIQRPTGLPSSALVLWKQDCFASSIYAVWEATLC